MTYQYIPGYLPEPTMFNDLWGTLAWEKRPDAPRKECWMNDFARSYDYGGKRDEEGVMLPKGPENPGRRTYYANPWNDIAKAIRDALNEDGYGYFEGCFANGYTGERDWLGWHADDDPGIDHSKPIVVVSFGQAREIQVKHNKDHVALFGGSGGLQTFMLESGSVFVMPAGSQFTHVHRIPKVGHAVGPRLSLTYRGLLS